MTQLTDFQTTTLRWLTNQPTTPATATSQRTILRILTATLMNHHTVTRILTVHPTATATPIAQATPTLTGHRTHTLMKTESLTTGENIQVHPTHMTPTATVRTSKARTA